MLNAKFNYARYADSDFGSLCQLCDDACTVVLNDKSLLAIKHRNIVLRGTRSTFGDGLWDIPITKRKNIEMSRASDKSIFLINISVAPAAQTPCSKKSKLNCDVNSKKSIST